MAADEPPAGPGAGQHAAPAKTDPAAATDSVDGSGVRKPMDGAGHEPARPDVRGPLRWVYLALAIVSLALAVIGVVLPGLPTTPFVLLAAWAAARSSPRLAAWLESHRLFGPLIRNWRNDGRVSRRAKWSATVAMLLCAGVLLATVQMRGAAWGGIAAMALVSIWLWRRPEG